MKDSASADPAVRGVALRTMVYHEVLVGYLADARRRGFNAMYIWACPPLQARAGDQLVVLAGGNVRAENVTRLLEQSHVREVHARGTDPAIVRELVRALATEKQ